ncbi:MAG: hypothetical protein HQ564_06915 [Candidatus Saganbacteria bacterium]|nr:hypothetical protein [Candidatus Saganbacteria bacterium]
MVYLSKLSTCKYSLSSKLHRLKTRARRDLPAYAGTLFPKLTASISNLFFREDILTQVQTKLRNVRALFAKSRYEEAKPLLEEIMDEIKPKLLQGADLEDPLLSHYYTTKIMLDKVVKWHQGMFRDGKIKSAAQILVFDSSGEKVLLQQRGSFKRLFANTYTVSANAKPKADQTLTQAAALAVKKETGVTMDPSRFKTAGPKKGYSSQLISYDFYAFSDEEEELLDTIYQEMKKSELNGILIHYDRNKRALSVMATDPSIPRSRVIKVAEKIKRWAAIPYIYPVFNVDQNSLLACRLTEKEEEIIRTLQQKKVNAKASATSALEKGTDPDTLVNRLKTIDSDNMVFMHWLEVRHQFKHNPTGFALDLTAPYFGSDTAWAATDHHLPDMVDITSKTAGFVHIVGGKGTNTNTLAKISKINPRVKIPRTSAITICAYEKLVLSNPNIRRQIKQLEQAITKAERKQIAQKIRNEIGKIKFPPDLLEQIKREFERLGQDIMVRSSANSEDMKKHTAAGRADSFSHQITIDQVCESVIKVWQSLFSDGFVEYRLDMGFPHSMARMAVLLQEFIPAKAAGVVFSFDPGSRRPVYRITAHPGQGEGVVEGEGLADRWLVGLLADQILERKIQHKKTRYLENKEGGISEHKIDDSTPSLEDDHVLAIGQIAKIVHEAYRKKGLADEIDIEYVLDKRNNEIVMVQARSKDKGEEKDQEGKSFFMVSTLDLSKVPSGLPKLSLYKNSQVAYPGAVVAPMQILPHTSEKYAAMVRPGVILVTHHTNNAFNSVFGSLAGVITTDGDPTSHAGQHAFEKRIPCLVSVVGAIEQLSPHEGLNVTFDAERKTVYLGELPIIQEERRLNEWLPDAESVQKEAEGLDLHEIFRPWDLSKLKRAEVFLEDLEGHWRRRSSRYPIFEVDYYYKAWDRLTEILNDMFLNRRPWVLTTQERQIKNEPHGISLMHKVTPNDPKSIYNFLVGSNNFRVEDCKKLFEARWEGFKKFAKFLAPVKRIDKSNVEAVVDNLVEIFSWMHFGFWLDAIVGKFSFDQLKYVSDEGAFHNFLREEAAADWLCDETIDPNRPDTPKRKVMNLSRQKDKKIYALLEQIRSTTHLLNIFLGSTSDIEEKLRKHHPHILDYIEQWSNQYKLNNENLLVLSDTPEYLIDLQRRLKTANNISPDMLLNFYLLHLESQQIEKADLEEIKKDDNNLYLLFKGHARMSGKDLLEVFQKVLEMKIDSDKRRSSAIRILDAYPKMKEILAISKAQLALREDGHHLIVPAQRKIARMMLDLGKRFVASGFFSKPKEIFNLTTDELVALLKEDDPSYTKMSSNRWAILREAELKMVEGWTFTDLDFTQIKIDSTILMEDLAANRYLNIYGVAQDRSFNLLSAADMELSPEFEPYRKQIFDALNKKTGSLSALVTHYAREVKKACRILDQQMELATIPRVKRYYQKEKERLQERVAKLQQKLLK